MSGLLLHEPLFNASSVTDGIGNLFGIDSTSTLYLVIDKSSMSINSTRAVGAGKS